MIRAVTEKLAIPAELLIREPAAAYVVSQEIREADVPVDLLAKRGWIAPGASGADLLRRYRAPAAKPVMLNDLPVFGGSERTNRALLWLWMSRVRELAAAGSTRIGRFRHEALDEALIRYVAKLSFMDKGPRLAKEFLEERGVAVIVEPHLPSTLLDGAAMIGRSGEPVIGLTLREDRLDNFRLTLVRELVHLWMNLDPVSRPVIADENIETAEPTERLEKESSQLATEILLPHAVWRRSEAFKRPSAKSIQALATELKISPSIVAGHIRRERKNRSSFAALVGYRQVRVQFSEGRWG